MILVLATSIGVVTAADIPPIEKFRFFLVTTCFSYRPLGIISKRYRKLSLKILTLPARAPQIAE